MLPLFYHPIYTEGIDPSARFPRERYRLLAERLHKHETIELREPRLATRDELALAHDLRYIDTFLANQLDEKAMRRIGLRPWTPAIVERTLRIAGGSLQALDLALETRGIAGNLAGGTHHAYRDFGSGYCIFNDVALCALNALQQKKDQRILSLDLDVHQGDGTASILAREPRVFTCSIHAQSNFPFRKQRSDLDIGLEDQLGDLSYMEILERAMDEIEADRFDLILFQAGVDTLAEDALGNLALTREGLRKRNQKVFELNAQHGIPIVIFMGGGYAKPIELTVDAFEDLFQQAAQAVSSARA
ncbi:histone deacetylase [Pelagicoccus sp. NFK12]|uniref:Histone deacetylase n=1 Tax=Pelagicoccus enzymogenes TaxID=2773457 RepID=A0A927FDZ8_9BACT|nr:histone deacetylase [Pelagicoccus enzymogenes]MBD5782046.1 histone deacetylase [Pelagicoccus enzymogenes]